MKKIVKIIWIFQILVDLLFLIIIISNLLLHLLPNSCNVNNQFSCNLYNVIRNTAKLSETLFIYTDPDSITINLVHKDDPYIIYNGQFTQPMSLNPNVQITVIRANGTVEHIQ